MSADALKQEGMDRALQKAHELWKKGYANLADRFFATIPVGGRFSGEQLHQYIDERLSLSAGSPQAKSAMFNSFISPLVRSGAVIPAEFVKSARASNHSRYCRTYVKSRMNPSRAVPGNQ